MHYICRSFLWTKPRVIYRQGRAAKTKLLFLKSPVSLSLQLVLQKSHLHGFHGNSAVLLIFTNNDPATERAVTQSLFLRPVSKAMKEKKGKKENQQSPEPDNFILFSIISENCKVQNRTNKLTELIISSHGQDTQIQLPAKVLGYLPYIQDRVISHKRQDLILSLVRFKPCLNQGCKPADKSLGGWNEFLKIGSNWENPVQPPWHLIYGMQKGEKAFGHR